MVVSKNISQQKYLSHSSPPTKNEVDFDIRGVKEKDKEKFDEIQDIKSQVQEHEEVGSPDEQKSEDNKTLDEHSKGENGQKVVNLQTYVMIVM